MLHLHMSDFPLTTTELKEQSDTELRKTVARLSDAIQQLQIGLRLREATQVHQLQSLKQARARALTLLSERARMSVPSKDAE